MNDVASKPGPLFTTEDVKTIVSADLQRQKKILHTNKIFVKNCNRAQSNIRQVKDIAQLAKVIQHYSLIQYLSNASLHMISVIAASDACPHDIVTVLMKDGQVWAVKCGRCGVLEEHVEKEYVPEPTSPEGSVIGTFTIGKTTEGAHGNQDIGVVSQEQADNKAEPSESGKEHTEVPQA